MMMRTHTRTLCGAVAALSLLFSGAAFAQIRIGQTSALTGPAASAVNEINIGAKLYLKAVNAEGGINGQAIELVSMDDNNKAAAAADNAAQLIAISACWRCS